MVTSIEVAVIGGGPRALSLLERITAEAPGAGARVRLHVVEPGALGPGLHDVAVDYLLLNTVCGQLTAFADPAMVLPRDPIGPGGPSLYEWCLERGVGVGAGGAIGRAGRPVEPTDYLPRRLLGEYLSWAWGVLAVRAGAAVEVVHHRARAVSVDELDNRPGSAARYVIELDHGPAVHAAHVVLAVGHGHPSESGRDRTTTEDPLWIHGPYPLPDTVRGIAPAARVGVLGAGLTAMDVIAALTVGPWWPVRLRRQRQRRRQPRRGHRPLRCRGRCPAGAAIRPLR